MKEIQQQSKQNIKSWKKFGNVVNVFLQICHNGERTEKFYHYTSRMPSSSKHKNIQKKVLYSTICIECTNSLKYVDHKENDTRDIMSCKLLNTGIFPVKRFDHQVLYGSFKITAVLFLFLWKLTVFNPMPHDHSKTVKRPKL